MNERDVMFATIKWCDQANDSSCNTGRVVYVGQGYAADETPLPDESPYAKYQYGYTREDG